MSQSSRKVKHYHDPNYNYWPTFEVDVDLLCKKTYHVRAESKEHAAYLATQKALKGKATKYIHAENGWTWPEAKATKVRDSGNKTR